MDFHGFSPEGRASTIHVVGAALTHVASFSPTGDNPNLTQSDI